MPQQAGKPVMARLAIEEPGIQRKRIGRQAAALRRIATQFLDAPRQRLCVPSQHKGSAHAILNSIPNAASVARYDAKTTRIGLEQRIGDPVAVAIRPNISRKNE